MTADREARVAWSAIAEPMDETAHGLVATMGSAEALDWLRGAVPRPAAAVAELCLGAQASGMLAQGVERWGPRLPGVDVARIMDATARIGARVLVPGDAGWPDVMHAQRFGVPHALWVRGDGDLDALFGRSLAVVGARAATAYGEHLATEIAGAAAERGVTVVSGGAYGIDAAAHRAALVAGGRSVAVLAGGVDRLYPSGNQDLLRRVMASGAVVSEQPPGFAPHRHRFLSRNRLIAAAGATVVVEASARSGALSTARHAEEMARPLGAVPGPVTSAGSAGCHALIRSGSAVLVSQPDHALELALAVGEVWSDRRDGAEEAHGGFRSAEERRAYGAIGLRGATTESVAVTGGMTVSQALGALATLEARGRVVRTGVRWRRTTERDPRKP